MFGRFTVIWALLTTAIAAGVGALAYHAGVTAQLAANGTAPPYEYYGFGFGAIFPLLFFLLLLSFAFRRRHWHGHGGGPWGKHAGWNPEERLQEWHRQAHGEQPPASTPGQA